MTNREKFTEIFGYEIAQRDTGEAIPGHCKILIASDNHFNEWLKQEYVPSAQPEWIPVTERLPKPNEYENDVRAYYLVQNEYGDMMVCSWDGRCWMQMYRHTHVEDKVVAWMPMPKPWEGENHDEMGSRGKGIYV